MELKDLSNYSFKPAFPGTSPSSKKNEEEEKRRMEEEAAQQDKLVGGMKKGGKVSSASKRADGIATKGKTKGRIV